ncbi:putative RNA recognition motif domain, nucleotide-binding alpha-beta plait domain superfamily [Dioscorea sansibarensis]
MRLRRWYCSPASLPSPSKKVSKRSEVAKVKRTMAVKSFVQRYMLAYPGVFPKPTEVRDAVGGSWHILKEILAEMKAEMLPASQIDQPTASTSFVADSSDAKEVEGNMGSGTVNTHEGFGSLTEMFNVAKVRTMEDKDPAVLASVENSENFELLQPKTRQEIMEDFTTSGSVRNQRLFCLINQIAGAGKQNTVATDTHRHSFNAKSPEDASSPCRSEDYRRRIGGVASSHCSSAPDQRNSKLDKTSPRNSVSLVELFTHRAEKIRFDCPNVDTMKRVAPVNFSGEGPGSINRTLGAEENKQTTVTTDNNGYSFKAKSLEDASSPCGSEGYGRRIGGMASNHDSLAPDQRNSELGKTSPRNPASLVELFTRNAEKVVFDCPNVNTLKKVTPVNLGEGGPGSLENLEKHPNLSYNYVFGEKIMKQADYLELKKVHSEESEMQLGVKGCLDGIVELARDTLKMGSWANESSNKINLLHKEASLKNSKAFVHQSLKHLGLNDQHTSRSQLEKKQANMPYEVTESEENEDSNCLKLETILLDKDEKAVDTTDGLNSLFISDESDSDISAFEYPSPEPNVEFPSSMKGFHLNINQHDEKLARNNRLLVYFLPKTAKAKDLIQAFCDSGPISEILILPSRENRFKYAQIFFKTEEGLRKALSKTDVTVGGADVAMEAAITPSEICDRRFCIEQVNSADFPDHFLKNPSRTVIINRVPDNLSFHDLKCALSTWGSITGIAMGTSVSTVFVEFESEKSKERALAEATISISGITLSILRVDAPRTTIIRISNVNPVSGAIKVHSICDSFGQVKRVAGRYIDTFDVHFKLSEWPNMLKIINRLNGLVVDQQKWTAQPATLIPAEVLQALWNKRESQRQVHELVRNLCERISDESIDTSSLLGLAEEYSSS